MNRVSAVAAAVFLAVMVALALRRGSTFVAGGPPIHGLSTPQSLPRAVPPESARPDAVSTEATFVAAPDQQLIAMIAARLDEWQNDDNPELRDARITEIDALLTGHGRRSIADRLAVLAALPPATMDFAFGLPSFQQWMLAAPTAALDWMSTHPGISDARLLTLFQRWPDRAALGRYLEALPDTEWKQRALTAATYATLPSDPAAAAGWAQQVPVDAGPHGLLDLATAEWARRDPVQAARWLRGVADFQRREELTGSLAVAFADTDPAGAAELATASIHPGAILDRSLAEIAGVWAKQDPAAVATWVAHVPDNELRRMALENLVSVWRASDRPALTAWAWALPDSALRQEATELVGDSAGQ